MKITNTLSKYLYNGEVYLIFYPDSHRYKIQGSDETLPSVTSITGMLDKNLMPWALSLVQQHVVTNLDQYGNRKNISINEVRLLIDGALKRPDQVRKEAAGFGTAVHAWAEEFVNNKMAGLPAPAITADMPNEVVAGINGFLDWLKSEPTEFIATERLIYSRKYGYVGLTDAIIKRNGKVYVVDYKTSKRNKYSPDGIYNEARYQVAAYRNAYEEECGPVDGNLVARFDKETGAFEVADISNDYALDLSAFLGLLAVKKREKLLPRVSTKEREAVA